MKIKNILLSWAPKLLRMEVEVTKLKETCFLVKQSYDSPIQHIKKQRHRFADKGLHSQSYGFTSSHAWMWELDHKEEWVLKERCFCIVVLEDSWESRGLKDQAVNPKGIQPWIFNGRTDTEAEAPILWPPAARADSLEKTLILGKIGGKRRKGQQRIKRLDSIVDSVDTNLQKLHETVKDRGGWRAIIHAVTESDTA